jgi:putative toxin-antitoxin system antitoxin component (TIGR02293 family)
MVTALSTRLEGALQAADLDREEVARVVGANPRTVTRWIKQQAAPRRDSRERLLEFIAVIERLSATLRAEPAHDWLFTPNPDLGHEKPADLLKQGHYRRVLGAIDALAEGVFV